MTHTQHREKRSFSVISVSEAYTGHMYINMRFKYLTVLVFFIGQPSINASGNESYPECLETSEGCAPTTDSPTTDSPVNSWIRFYCGEDLQLPLFEAPSMLIPLMVHIPHVWGLVVFLTCYVSAVLICCSKICCSNFQLKMDTVRSKA